MTNASGARFRLLTPLHRVRGLGSGHTGTHHFWVLRLTSVALLPLTGGFIVIVLALLGRNQAAVVQILGSPLVAIVMLLFVLASIYHMWLGIQESIVDYIHGDLSKLFVLMANSFVSLVLVVACVFALLKLSFGV